MLNEAGIQFPFFFAIIAFQKSYNTSIVQLDAKLGIVNSTDPYYTGVMGVVLLHCLNTSDLIP